MYLVRPQAHPGRFWAASSGAEKGLNTDFYDLSNIGCGWGKQPSSRSSNIIQKAIKAHRMSNEDIVSGGAWGRFQHLCLVAATRGERTQTTNRKSKWGIPLLFSARRR